MAQAAAAITRVAPPTTDLVAGKAKADRFAALGCDLLEILQMARLNSTTIEGAMEQEPFDGKDGLLFIDAFHRDNLIFAAQHLQDMIDDFRSEFFDIVQDVSPANPSGGGVRDRDIR